MLVEPSVPYPGQHCETTATGTLLLQHGICLSEPMLFGLGEGLSFIFWNMKSMEFPFIGGRTKPDLLTQNIAARLEFSLEVHETASTRKAWEHVKANLDQNRLVGLKLDSFYLEYFTKPFHFAGHYVTMYGYDESFAYLVDTKQQGGKVTTSLQSLEHARNAKGPMSSKNLSYTLTPTGKPWDLAQAVRTALRNNANTYLSPPITNISYLGIAKIAAYLPTWFAKSPNRSKEFCTTAMLMEKAGTGGALFRNLYRDFLEESQTLLGGASLKQAHALFSEAATQWTEVAHLLEQAGKTEQVRHVQKAAGLLISISKTEHTAMKLVQEAS